MYCQVSIFALLVAFVMAAGVSPSSADEPKSGKVAVLRDPSFPPYLTTDVSPESLGKALDECGIEYRFVDMETLAEPGALSTDEFSALVHVYGNTFPQALMEPLRDFRSQGGIFLSTGVPLTHPVEKIDGAWKDKGHTIEYAEHQSNGLGTGLFKTLHSDRMAVTKLGTDLGLNVLDWSYLLQPATVQGLEVSSLDEADRVESVFLAGDATSPFVSIVSHGCELCKGGVDIWAGMGSFSFMPEASEYLSSEIIARTLAYVLNKKGLLANSQFEQIVARALDQASVQRIADGFTPIFIDGERERIYPPVGPKPERLLTLDIRECSPEERVLASVAQGLINSTTDSSNKVYLIKEPLETAWSDWLLEHKRIESVENLSSLRELLELTGVERCVIADATPSHSLAIAINVAGAERLLVALSESVAEEYDLEIAIDLRGRWKTNVEAYQWVLDKYEFSQNVMAILHPKPSLSGMFDYVIATRAFMFWVSGSLDGSEPGGDPRAEEKYFTQTLAERFPVNIPVVGYPWNGHNVGIGETGGVTLLSRAGKFLVPMDRLSNVSALTTIPSEEDAVKTSMESIPLDKSKNYATVLVTDGDNLCTFGGYFLNYWRTLGEKDFPVAWTMGPTLCEVLPPFYDRVQMERPAGDTFGTGVSGVGYVSPAEYGKSFPKYRDAVMKEFMELTARYMERTGERWLWIMRYGGPHSRELNYYAKYLTNDYDAICGGYGRETRLPDEAAEFVDGISVFNSVASSNSPDAAKRDVEEMLEKAQSPLFMHLPVMNWYFPPEKLRDFVAFLESKGVVIVTPEQLADLHRQQ